MNVLEYYTSKNIKVAQELAVTYKIGKVPKGKNPLNYAFNLNVESKGEPKYFCEICNREVEEPYEHTKIHVEDDTDNGIIRDDDKEPVLECPKCGKIMRMKFMDASSDTPLYCDCGYSYRIMLFDDRKYIITKIGL